MIHRNTGRKKTLTRIGSAAFLGTCLSHFTWGGPISNLGAEPQAIFTKESTHIAISARVSSSEVSKPFLLELDSSGSPLRIIGGMNDLGRWGDRLKGDGFFTRKVQVSQKKTGFLYYGIALLKEGEDLPETLPPQERVSVEVLGRPSFIQAVSKVWAKFKKSFSN